MDRHDPKFDCESLVPNPYSLIPGPCYLFLPNRMTIPAV
jgi:hypothetical protein